MKNSRIKHKINKPQGKQLNMPVNLSISFHQSKKSDQLSLQGMSTVFQCKKSWAVKTH